MAIKTITADGPLCGFTTLLDVAVMVLSRLKRQTGADPLIAKLARFWSSNGDGAGVKKPDASFLTPYLSFAKHSTENQIEKALLCAQNSPLRRLRILWLSFSSLRQSSVPHPPSRDRLHEITV